MFAKRRLIAYPSTSDAELNSKQVIELQQQSTKARTDFESVNKKLSELQRQNTVLNLKVESKSAEVVNLQIQHQSSKQEVIA